MSQMVCKFLLLIYILSLFSCSTDNYPLQILTPGPKEIQALRDAGYCKDGFFGVELGDFECENKYKKDVREQLEVK